MSLPPLRLARPEEAEALAALVGRAYAAYLPVIGRRPAPMDDDYAARIAAGQAWVLEAEDGGLAGLLVLEVAGSHLWLENVAVDPARQRAGLGRALMRFVGGEALRRGLPEVRLLTNERMERNLAFYARLGFAELERREEKGFRRVYMAIPAERLAG
ncbi:GNAT family N-acetyltransferase [Teichococcus aestuarii]|uniref:GNAT family N-acetyltransferase n=1 Tax=Teichococcus aestuarii TaxID=568898 RepID=A0A2U1V7Q4_9PROT|nr:GNAT family N-acetyltransferase [Pseudoroseomonas aestuarii]PWC29947.1 GNAT family N-acetyltransferase [Pseudoroseomonas aestuarii]